MEIPPPQLIPPEEDYSGEVVFLNTINILAFHIRMAIPTIGKTPEMREFQSDLEIGSQRLNEHLNEGDDMSEDISFY